MPARTAKTKSSAKTQAAPWWLSEGEEECAHCGQSYHLEVEFRCPECDGPGCAHCRSLHAEGHHVCPECMEVAEPQSARNTKSSKG